MRKSRFPDQVIQGVSSALAELLDVSREAVVAAAESSEGDGLELSLPPYRFIVEYRSVGSATQVLAAIDRLRQVQDGRKTVPLVAVPYMGEVGRRLCNEAGIGWFDLSGNSWIRAKGLLIRVEGRPNRFKTIGRPANVFAPKSARIARRLLIDPNLTWSQRELAQATEMDEGFVSRIVSRLIRQELIVRQRNGRLRLRDPRLLFQAWAESYRFAPRVMIQGHAAARSGEELQARVARELSGAGGHYAATGLGAAWLYCHFAMFRLSSFYLEKPPGEELLNRLGFNEGPRGANLWLVVPNDPGVFQGTQVLEDIVCVHPVQAVLDLAGHPERAPEAAERLRDQFLNWNSDAD